MNNYNDDRVNIREIVENLLKKAFEMRVSDIHFEPFEKNVVIRFRVDGMLKVDRVIQNDLYNAILVRIKILSQIDITKNRFPQDGRFNYRNGVEKYDCRVSTIPLSTGERLVIRLLNSSNQVLDMENLGLLDDELRRLKKILITGKGLILVTGSTGSGKTTSLYTFLRFLNKETINIMTVEDPIEFVIDGVSQIPVNHDSQLDFADAMRSIIRQDPNVVMLGEIRDLESAVTCVRLAITGHLVLSTLHTSEVGMVVNRLVDMGVEKSIVVDSLECVISQMLVRKLCPHCKKRYQIKRNQGRLLGLEEEEIFQKVGCEKCQHTGYYGRIAIQEILFLDDEIKRLFFEGVSLEQIRIKIKEKGMLTFQEKAKKYLLEGIIDIEEMIRNSLY